MNVFIVLIIACSYFMLFQVTNISPSCAEADLLDFFSTAGDVEKIEQKNGKNNTKRATIDFKEKEAVSAALLLNGCLLLNHALQIEEIKYPADELDGGANDGNDVGLTRGETYASGILAKTITLSKQAGQAIKQFDEQHKISETIVTKSTTAYKNVDEKLKITETTASANIKIKEESQKLDEKFKISATTGAAAEVVKTTTNGVVQKINENPAVQKASTAVSNAFSFLSQKANAIMKTAVKQSEDEMPTAAAATTKETPEPARV